MTSVDVKTFNQLVEEAAARIKEMMPWDLSEKLSQNEPLLLLDVREPDEFAAMRIRDSMNVPRGVLEAAAEFGYDETEPRLANSREQQIVTICRSGRRSCLAANTLSLLGFNRASSLKTGLRGWNDYEQPLFDATGNRIDGDIAEEFLRSKIRTHTD